MAKYQTLEEIRKQANLSQTEFAEMIGLSFRGYQSRLNYDRPHWRIGELIKGSDLNGGLVTVEISGTDYDGDYDISIKKK